MALVQVAILSACALVITEQVRVPALPLPLSYRSCPRIQCDPVPRGCEQADYFMHSDKKVCPTCTFNKCAFKPCDNRQCPQVPEGCGQMTLGRRERTGELCVACPVNLCKLAGSYKDVRPEVHHRTKRQSRPEDNETGSDKNDTGGDADSSSSNRPRGDAGFVPSGGEPDRFGCTGGRRGGKRCWKSSDDDRRRYKSAARDNCQRKRGGCYGRRRGDDGQRGR